MILRRVIAHFRKQEWTAIALDFLIVVIGVFVGLQVNNWNEGLRTKADERAVLSRLQLESEEVVKFWSRDVQVFGVAIENQRLLLEALKAGAIPPEQRAAIDDALLRISFYPAVTAPHSVYDEVIASGGLRLISDFRARQSVSAYAAEADFVDGQLDQFRGATQQVYLKALAGKVFSAYAPERASLRRYEYDFAALAADRQFVSDIVDLARDQRQFQSYRERTLKAAVEMCEAVSAAVSQTCDIARPDPEEIIDREGVNP